MSNYVLTLKLKTEKWQEDVINKRLEICRNIYNANLREIMKRDRKVRHDPMYKEMRRAKTKKEKNEIFKALNQKYGLSQYDLSKFTTPMNRHFAENIPSDIGINQSRRAWFAYEKVKFGDGKKMRFKKFGEMDSMEGKKNTGILYKNGMVTMNPRKANKKLNIPVIIDDQDEYMQNALHDEIRYCRIVRKVIRGKYMYYVQLVMKGTPPNKHIEEIDTDNKTVGIDIGTSTIAVVTEDNVMLKVLSQSMEENMKIFHQLDRKMDRQRRANNPHKYNENDTIKRNNLKWVYSKKYLETKAKRREIYRKLTEQRRIHHQTLANQIVKMGSNVKVETMNFKGLQARTKETTINEKTGRNNKKKRFGKSLSMNAPSMLIAEIDKKLSYVGKSINKLNTYTMKASQYNHITDEYVKKKLSDRYSMVGTHRVQRDLYSAFLIMNADENSVIDRDECVKHFDKFIKNHDMYLKKLKDDKVRHHCF